MDSKYHLQRAKVTLIHQCIDIRSFIFNCVTARRIIDQAFYARIQSRGSGLPRKSQDLVIYVFVKIVDSLNTKLTKTPKINKQTLLVGNTQLMCPMLLDVDWEVKALVKLHFIVSLDGLTGALAWYILCIKSTRLDAHFLHNGHLHEVVVSCCSNRYFVGVA